MKREIALFLFLVFCSFVIYSQTETEPSSDGFDVFEPPVNFDEYSPMYGVSVPPRFDEQDIAHALVYPPNALSSGIEGQVILELFIDRKGKIQRILILREEPEGNGFGEAAVKAFTGKIGIPAMANNKTVPVRYRYPISFKIR